MVLPTYKMTEATVFGTDIENIQVLADDFFQAHEDSNVTSS